MALGEDRREGQRKRATVAFGPGYRLPEGGLGRVLALWGFTGVPFFRAFREPNVDDRTRIAGHGYRDIPR